MSTRVYIKPAPGRTVLVPERQYLPLPEQGMWVARDSYWARRIESRDVIVTKQPAVKAVNRKEDQ